MANEKNSKYLKPATDKAAYPTTKERMVKLVEMQVRLLAQIDVISKYGDEKDKLINRQKVWDMANDLDKNAFVHSIYEEEHKKALQKFSGVTDKKANIDGFDEFE